MSTVKSSAAFRNPSETYSNFVYQLLRSLQRSMESEKLKGVDRYTKVRNLGSKVYGTVVLATDKFTNQKVAIKRLERGLKVDESVNNEITNHQTFFHPHIVDFEDCFLTEKHLCLVTEYASVGNLMNFINKRKRVEVNLARWFFQQLIIAVDYCHKMGVAVRNIRLDTILLDADSTWPVLKLFDFRYSVNDNQSTPSELVSAPIYMAPEVITKKDNEAVDEKKTDIWSCGVLLYAMTFSYYPFIRKEDVNIPDSVQRIHKRIVDAPLTFPQHKESSADVRDLLSKMLEKDPNKRITLNQVMKHKWFQVYLPEGALELNEKIESRQNGLKSEVEIAELIEHAKIPYSAENKDVHY
eukprot:g3159.t1